MLRFGYIIIAPTGALTTHLHITLHITECKSVGRSLVLTSYAVKHCDAFVVQLYKDLKLIKQAQQSALNEHAKDL